MRPFLLIVILFLAACVPQVPTTLPPTVPPVATTAPANLPATIPPVVTTAPANPPVTIPPVVTTAPANPPVTLAPGVSPTPGLVLRGHVRLADGSGVPGVTICRSYASYSGEVVATTDASGYYESAFAFIPGDEMVSVWALAPGYTFNPPYDYWRHYFGLEDHSLDFVAAPASATAVPPNSCK